MIFAGSKHRLNNTHRVISSRADILDLKLLSRCRDDFVRGFSVFLDCPQPERASPSAIHPPEKLEELCCQRFLQNHKKQAYNVSSYIYIYIYIYASAAIKRHTFMLIFILLRTEVIMINV